jgi:hypothetical protein
MIETELTDGGLWADTYPDPGPWLAGEEDARLMRAGLVIVGHQDHALASLQLRLRAGRRLTARG